VGTKLGRGCGQGTPGSYTETENIVRKFIARWAQHFDNKRYFRFNVEQGLQDVGLAEYKEQGVIESATDEYLRHIQQKSRVRDCVLNLRQKQVCILNLSPRSTRRRSADVVSPLGVEIASLTSSRALMGGTSPKL
jgi:hypothetical protein